MIAGSARGRRVDEAVDALEQVGVERVAALARQRPHRHLEYAVLAADLDAAELHVARALRHLVTIERVVRREGQRDVRQRERHGWPREIELAPRDVVGPGR